MNINYVSNYEEMSQMGAKLMIDTIKNKSNASICLATGSSPKRMYEIFVDKVNKENIDISEVTFVKLDEWIGLSEEDPNSCTGFIRTHVLDSLHNKPKAYIEMKTDNDAFAECEKMDHYLKENPIDLMILGLGMDAHLGLNEPNEYLTLNCHKAILNEKTKNHDMAKGKSLSSGLTIGMGGIFESKQVLMLVCGTRKEEAYETFMSRKISTQAPCSFLWLHSNCFTIIDREQFPSK